jgi:hypothetical protein
MKGNPKTAIYLICDKNKSLQRKHVEVCSRCESNSRCKPYLEYRQSISAENFVEATTDVDRSQLLRHIVQELREIKKLVHTDPINPPAPDPKKRKHRFRQKIVIADIQTTLKDIQSLCNPSKF